MNLFSNNYDKLKEQILALRSNLVKCNKPGEYHMVYSSYLQLCDIYKHLTGEDLYDLNPAVKEYLTNLSAIQAKSDSVSFYSQFFDCRAISYELFKRGLDGFDKLDLSITDNQDTFSSFSSEQEVFELLHSFLSAEFPEAIPVLLELMSSGSIFLTGENWKIPVDSCFFNFNDNVGNIFLRGPIRNIEDLASFVHELGHIVDCRKMSEQTDDICSGTKVFYGLDSEVVSSYYEMRFLEHCIKNDVYKDDACRVAITSIGSALFHLSNGCYLSMADENEYAMLKKGDITMADYIDRISQRTGDTTVDAFDGGFYDYKINLPETIKYSYGIVLGFTLTDGDYIESFMRNRSESDFSNRLVLSEITPDLIFKEADKKVKMLEQSLGVNTL